MKKYTEICSGYIGRRHEIECWHLRIPEMTDIPAVDALCTDVTFAVLYTCDLCRTLDREVTVRERRPETDVLAWMNYVTALLRADHATISPDCRPQFLTNMKIPLSGGDSDYIGKARRQ